MSDEGSTGPELAADKAKDELISHSRTFTKPRNQQHQVPLETGTQRGWLKAWVKTLETQISRLLSPLCTTERQLFPIRPECRDFTLLRVQDRSVWAGKLKVSCENQEG